MFRLTTLLLTCFLFANAVFAQKESMPTGSLANQSNLQDLATTGIARIFDNRYEGTKGNPYLIDEFSSAKVYLSNNSVIADIKIKYNVYDNSILYISSSGEQLIFDASHVNDLVLEHPSSKSNLQLKKMTELATIDAKLGNSLMIYLFESSKFKFVLHSSKELIKADYKGSTYGATRNYDEFRVKKNYFLKTEGSVQKIKLTKKSLTALLQDKSKYIEEFIKKEKIDASTEQGWIQTLAYYETL